MNVVEWAAQSWDFVGDATIEVTLRDNLVFHDAEPVRAEDFAFGYEYFRNWEVGLYAHTFTALDSAETVDDRTVRFNLNEPTSTFRFSTMTQIFIVPQHIWGDLVESDGLDHPQDRAETT